MENLPTNILARINAVPFTGKLQNGNCVLYVMSRDQRVSDNHALFVAQQHALQKKLPFTVVFILHRVSQKRAKEHYEFMLAGLRELELSLKTLNIPFMLLIGNPIDVMTATIGHLKPDAVYLDLNPLKGPKNFAKYLSRYVPTVIVDTHNVVPVWTASNKQEYGARTIRPKIHKQLADFTVSLPEMVAHPYVWPGKVLSLSQLDEKISTLLDSITSNGTTIPFVSGEIAAKKLVNTFIAKQLRGYAQQRNDPSKNSLSNFSPYLHFGQLSSLYVYLRVTEAALNDPELRPDADALIEEMIVRKELSDNYCYYNENYDSLTGAPQWALNTLRKHQTDAREFVYTNEQFKNAQTHDEAWNAAQRQLTTTGKMHGYMRMYWAKKVLERSKTPQEAHELLVELNDFYSIDGGDPNGYVGILWSIAGLHDRPWGERNIYGTVRCMVYAGLKRKFDIAAYIDYNKT